MRFPDTHAHFSEGHACLLGIPAPHTRKNAIMARVEAFALQRFCMRQTCSE